MFNIIRNCSHFSDMHTGFMLNEKGFPVSVIKKAFSRFGANALLSEHRGISWYCDRIGINPECKILKFYCLDSYGVLKLGFHPEEPGDFTIPITENYDKIINLIDHYAAIFCKDNQVFRHGDLSLGNILFKENTVKWIIDWENVNNIVPREYDLVYCITENCFFRLLANKKLTKDEILTYKALLNEIDKKIGIDFTIKSNPAKWCQNAASDYAKKSNIEHKKCPFIACDEKIINTLDSLLGE